MNPSEILKAAKAKIANYENWTQGVLFGINPYDEGCARLAQPSESIDATCYCAIGAVRATPVSNFYACSLAEHQLDTCAFALFGFYSIVSLNDDLDGGFDAVHIVYDAAIEQLESEGK